MCAIRLLGKGVFPEVGNKFKSKKLKEIHLETSPNELPIIVKKDQAFNFDLILESKVRKDNNKVDSIRAVLKKEIYPDDKISIPNGPSFSVSAITKNQIQTIVEKGGKLNGKDQLIKQIKEGYIDFYVNSHHQYGFEFLIEGRLMEEHYNRFRLNGDYSFLKLKNFQIINFTSKKPQKSTWKSVRASHLSIFKRT